MKKILYLEDDRQFQNLVQMKLHQEGYSVVLASDADEAYEKYTSEKPDMLILDAMTPVEDSFDLCAKIRQSDKAIPIIIVSGVYNKSEYRQKAEESGANCFIPKPFDLKEFVLVIHRIFEEKQGS